MIFPKISVFGQPYKAAATKEVNDRLCFIQSFKAVSVLNQPIGQGRNVKAAIP